MTELREGRPFPLLVSEAIPRPFAHGFTTRAGGVSAPPFDSLNLGMSWGDARQNVLENRRRLAAAAGARALYLALQVHGAAVARVRAGDQPAAVARNEVDALVTDLPGAAVAVFTADCVPLLMADARTGACAAVHAGWRGVVGKVATATVIALGREFGGRAEDLRVALGPAIGRCCFEVGPEVAAAFQTRFPQADREGVVLERPAGKLHVDLRLALRRELETAGVPALAIDVAEACTRCDPAGRFYSYRRDGTRTGQHLGFILRRS
jgi:polyphenol oxidase